MLNWLVETSGLSAAMNFKAEQRVWFLIAAAGLLAVSLALLLF